MDFDQLDDVDADAETLERKTPADSKATADPWRLGHRRPWWQWNVLTLFAALFVLVWVREFLQLTPAVNIVICIFLFGIWALGPVGTLEPKPRPEPPRRESAFPSQLDRPPQPSASPAPGRAALLMIAGGLIVLVFAVGGMAAGVMAIWVAILTAVAFRA